MLVGVKRQPAKKVFSEWSTYPANDSKIFSFLRKICVSCDNNIYVSIKNQNFSHRSIAIKW